MRGAYSGQTPRDNLAAFGYKLGEQSNVLVIDGLNFLGTELANLLAPEILAACSPAALAPAGGTGRTALAAIGTVPAKRSISGRPLRRRPIAGRGSRNAR